MLLSMIIYLRISWSFSITYFLSNSLVTLYSSIILWNCYSSISFICWYCCMLSLRFSICLSSLTLSYSRDSTFFLRDAFSSSFDCRRDSNSFTLESRLDFSCYMVMSVKDWRLLNLSDSFCSLCYSFLDSIRSLFKFEFSYLNSSICRSYCSYSLSMFSILCVKLRTSS